MAVTGGRAENQALLDERFDYIFFTGGATVGKLVLEKAAVHATPVTLELGGKSPCIVDETADIAIAGKRIAFGSGTSVQDVNRLMKQFDEMRKMIRAMTGAADSGKRRKRMPNMPFFG